jgi:hypothetical protein
MAPWRLLLCRQPRLRQRQRGGGPDGADGFTRLALLWFVGAAGPLVGAAGRWGGCGALRSWREDTRCSASSSGTATVGMRTSGRVEIASFTGVTAMTRNPVRPPSPSATSRSVMPSASNHSAPRRPAPRAIRCATIGAATPIAMSPRPAGSANRAGRCPRPIVIRNANPATRHVWEHQTARRTRSGQGARDRRNPACGQQGNQHADRCDSHPRQLLSELRVVCAGRRDRGAGREPAAEHGGGAPGEQCRPSAPKTAAFRTLVQHNAGQGQDPDRSSQGQYPQVIGRGQPLLG